MDKCRLPTGADSGITGHSIYTGPKSVETRRSHDPQRYNPHMHIRAREAGLPRREGRLPNSQAAVGKETPREAELSRRTARRKTAGC